MKNIQTWIAEAWERLIAARAEYEETACLGRLFNTLMVIGTGVERLCIKSVTPVLLGGKEHLPGSLCRHHRMRG